MLCHTIFSFAIAFYVQQKYKYNSFQLRDAPYMQGIRQQA